MNNNTIKEIELEIDTNTYGIIENLSKKSGKSIDEIIIYFLEKGIESEENR